MTNWADAGVAAGSADADPFATGILWPDVIKVH
jgi:hypothetical protein